MEGSIFKWIFGIVAGGLVFIFLIRFALQESDISSMVDTRVIVNNLENQLEAVGISESTNKKIKFGKEAEIIIGCDAITSEDYRKKTEKIIFSSGVLSGETLNVWSREWKYPFKIDNFFYLQDESDRAILIYDQKSGNYVKNLVMPSIFNVQRMDVKNFDANRIKREHGNNEIVLAFFTDAKGKGELNADVIEVNLENSVIENVNTGDKDWYLGEEMMIGAVFGIDNYKCIKERMMERLEMMSRLYSEKARLMAQKNLDGNCKAKLFEISNVLEGMSKAKDFGSISNYMQTSEQLANNLEGSGCGKIF